MGDYGGNCQFEGYNKRILDNDLFKTCKKFQFFDKLCTELLLVLSRVTVVTPPV